MLEYLQVLVMSNLPAFMNHMVSKNVMFTKLLQSMAGIENMPQEINDLIRKNTDKVHYTDEEIDYKLLLKVVSDYKITLDSLVPINSGMVAIVFSGINADKKRVIVKIKRNNIRERIKDGYLQFSRIYNLVSTLAYPFGYLDEILVNIKSFIDSRDYILTQCNFDNEISAITVTKDAVEQYTKDIVIPTIYNTEQDRTDTEFIIMDLIEGTTCYDIDEKYKEQACELIFRFSFITSYFSDIYHVDLHPGNIFCIPDGDKCKIGVIDFGMNVLANDEIRTFSHGCLNGLIEIDNGNTTNLDILQHCARTTVPPMDLAHMSPEQYNHLNSLFIQLVETVGDGKLGEKSLHMAIDGIRKVIKSRTIVLSDDIIKYAMGLSMLQSSARLLVGDKKQLSNIVKKALREVMNY
jgi:predicted unusual protein kinase regulating ubiquinone biosynthesis (AarF/ABC1/UbiB family)